MSRVEALVTPSVIRWARETSGLSTEKAAKKLSRPVEDVEAWESGLKRPSIAQARKASEIYRRALAVFYLPEPPKDYETLRDFRCLPDDEDRKYSPELLLIMRTAIEHQQWTREFLIDEGMPPLPFVGSATVDDNPREVGEDILRVLEISPDEQCDCRSRGEALRLWMSKAEKKGIFVFRQGKIDLRQSRGFIISDEIAPFIYLNSEDAQAAQIFTLVHELAHLWLNQSGVSNIVTFGAYQSVEASMIEPFCNKVASEALLFRDRFDTEWNNLSSSMNIGDRIEKISRIFKVSEEAIARRLLEKDDITNDKYEQLREYYQDRWLELKEKERKRLEGAGGGPSFYVQKVSKNGYAFTQTVVSAFNSGAISGREASALLGVKVNHMPILALTAGFPLSSRI